MRHIDRFLLAYFLPRLRGRVCPSTVHRSGTAGMQVNFFSTTLLEAAEPNYLLLAVNGTDVEALKYDGERYSMPTTLPLESIDPVKLQVTHFYGLDEVRYEGIWAIAPGLWTRWPYAVIHLRRLRNSIAQRLFNRRALEVRRRLDVLIDVVSATMDGDHVGALDLMSAKYGDRWAGHSWDSGRSRVSDTREGRRAKFRHPDLGGSPFGTSNQRVDHFRAGLRMAEGLLS